MKLSVAEAASILENVRVARRSPASLAAHPHETARARQVDEQRALANEALDPHVGLRELAGSIAALAAAQAPAVPASAPPPRPRPVPQVPREPMAARELTMSEYLERDRRARARSARAVVAKRAAMLASYSTSAQQISHFTESTTMLSTNEASLILEREISRLQAKRTARQPSARQLACAELDRRMGLAAPSNDCGWLSGNRFALPTVPSRGVVR